MLGCDLGLNGVSNPKPRAAFSLSASLIYNLASLQAKPPCLGGMLLYLNSLPAPPTAQTAAFFYLYLYASILRTVYAAIAP